MGPTMDEQCAPGHRARKERAPGAFACAITVLVQRCAAGDPAAMGRLYDATAPVIYRLACAATGEQGAACRLTRAVYLQAWQTSPTYHPAELCAIAWLLHILREQISAFAEHPS